jgi:hypothetical protein
VREQLLKYVNQVVATANKRLNEPVYSHSRSKSHSKVDNSSRASDSDYDSDDSSEYGEDEQDDEEINLLRRQHALVNTGIYTAYVIATYDHDYNEAFQLLHSLQDFAAAANPNDSDRRED